jgi:predicted dehydrogenase
MKQSDPVLVIGAGSIGERHIRNLLSLGYSNILVLRARRIPLRTLNEETIQVINSLDELGPIQPIAAFICTPTSFHLQQAIICAEKGIHLFIEKPLSHTLEGIHKLKQIIAEKEVYVKIGYMMRFHPLMLKVKEIIEQRTYGNLLSFTTHWGEYLPDWHPWEDYRTSYAAKKELGGGAALTLSHDIDLVNWLMGFPLENYCVMKNHRSSLEVNVEAGIDFLVKYQNGITGHIHLNFFEKPANRYMLYVFEEASVHFNYYQAMLAIKTTEEVQEIAIENFDRNQLFIDQTVAFFNELEKFTVQDSLKNIAESEIIIEMCR